MDTKIISSREITTDNPTMCMLPIRYYNRCHHCGVFRSVLKRNNGDIPKTIKILKCNPCITNRAIFLIGQRKAIRKATEEKIKEINKELGEV